jgi:hypothetical protein
MQYHTILSIMFGPSINVVWDGWTTLLATRESIGSHLVQILKLTLSKHIGSTNYIIVFL